MSSLDENLSWITRYYDEMAEVEWNRLERHPVELELTLRAVLERIPQPPLKILDCGGGPGRYAIELARRGYTVTLFDLSPGNLALARTKAEEAGVSLAAFELGSATDLSRFPNGEAGGFDVVLMFGPLYHLLAEADRMTALAEARRVLKPGGWLFAAWITRYAALRDQAAKNPSGLMEEWDVHQRILLDGQLPPRSGAPDEFIAYFAHPSEVEPALWSAGFEVDQILAVEGLLGPYENSLSQLPVDLLKSYLELHYRTAQDSSTFGCSDHVLAAARRPAWRWVLGRIVTRLNQAGIFYRIVGGTSLALHGVPVPVKDIDVETTEEGAYQIQALFQEQEELPVALRESSEYRSHFGRFDFDGLKMEVMGDLQRRTAQGWVASATSTETQIPLVGDVNVFVRVSWLEEEVLAYLRRGWLDRAATCLPYCSHEWLLSLLRGEQPSSVL